MFASFKGGLRHNTVITTKIILLTDSPFVFQEAFFGRDLLDKSRQPDIKTPLETLRAAAAADVTKGTVPQVPNAAVAVAASDAIKKQGPLRESSSSPTPPIIL